MTNAAAGPALQACPALRQAEGPEGSGTVWAKHELALCHGFLGRHVEALALCEAVWQVQRRPDVLGEDHPDTLNMRAQAAVAWGMTGAGADAVAAFEKVRARERETGALPEPHPKHLYRRAQLGRLKRAAGAGDGEGDGSAESFDGLRAALLERVAPTHHWLRDLEAWQAEDPPDPMPSA